MLERGIKMNKYLKNTSLSLFIILALSNITFGQDFFFGNNKPIADAGKDIKTRPGETIFLDGSRSNVGDGSKIKYHWTFAPGLVLKSENNFTSEISVDTYGGQYIKSVQTRKQVLNVIAADNNPGTKLEVILKVKDRIGFEDRDTLIVEYLPQRVKAVEISNPTTETLPTPTDLPIDIDQDNTTFSGIFVQGFSDNAIKNIDAQIINSIIMSEIKTLGFQLDVFLETDIEGRVKPKGFNEKCNTDACIAKNARALNARYVIAWNFSQSIDNLSLRIFESIDHINLIEDADITGPYAHMNEVGIYGLESKLRSSVTKLMSASNFKSEIPTLDRLIMKNESLISYSKYPIILGAAYLLIDKIFSEEEGPTDPEMPPGFPHD